MTRGYTLSRRSCLHHSPTKAQTTSWSRSAIADEIGGHAGTGAAQGHDILPLVGARHRDQQTELFGALDVTLTAAHLSKLAGIFPVRGFPPASANRNRSPHT